MTKPKLKKEKRKLYIFYHYRNKVIKIKDGLHYNTAVQKVIVI